MPPVPKPKSANSGRNRNLMIAIAVAGVVAVALIVGSVVLSRDSGGDGAQTVALLVARAAINEGFDATHIPSYGPESRGGTSYADVRIADVVTGGPL